MHHESSILRFLKTVCRFSFGEFENEEFKKFIRLGLIFALILGVYWTLKPLKDAVFIHLVDRLHIPFAKTLSVIALLPLVMFYTKLLEKNSREKMLILLPTLYGIAIIVFCFLIMWCQTSQETTESLSLVLIKKGIGYLFYFFVESFGSLVVALFWAFATDTTDIEPAKKGFPLVVAIGQLGGVVLPYTICGLPLRLGFHTDAISLFILGFFTLLIIPTVNYFLKKTPKNLLVSFSNNTSGEETKKEETGFFEGFKLLLKNKYLLAIFGANFVYEVIITIFDFNFKLAASAQYSGVALTHYLSIYASCVNIVSFLWLLFGISNLTRSLGVGTALIAMPIIVACAVIGFLSLNSLTFLFILMAGSKSVNQALNGPALKQLYIPTTPNVKFKAQAWIETFGSRLSKQSASIFNMSLVPLQSTFGALAGKAHYMMLSGILCFPLIGLWLIIAVFLGKTFQKAIRDHHTIC